MESNALLTLVFHYALVVYEVPNLKWEGHVYSRLSNPGRDAFETTLAACARAKCKLTIPHPRDIAFIAAGE